MLDAIFILTIVGFSVLIFGFVRRDFWISALASMFIMALGVYIIGNGLAGTNDWITQTFGAICIALAGYVLLRGAIEMAAKELGG